MIMQVFLIPQDSFFATDATDVQIQILPVFNFQLDQYVVSSSFSFSIHGHYAVCKLKRIQGHVLRPGFLDMTSWSAPWSKQFLVGVNMVILNVGDLACNISDMNIMNQWQQKRGVCGNGSASPSSNLFHPFPP
jgi:hypothetical protein